MEKKTETPYKGLGEKALDGAKKIVKHLPIVDFNFYIDDFLKGKIKTTKTKTLMRLAYNFLVPPIIFAYVFFGAVNSTWTPKQYKEIILEKQEQKQYKNNINNSYNKLFENAANFEDSLRIYQENNLPIRPIKLLEPSFKDKERALEGRVE